MIFVSLLFIVFSDDGNPLIFSVYQLYYTFYQPVSTKNMLINITRQSASIY